MIDFKIADLLAQAFRVSSPVFLPSASRQEAPGIEYKEPEKSNASGADRFPGIEVMMDDIHANAKIGYLGTPLVFPMTFKGRPDYKTFDFNGNLKTVALSDFLLPAATLVDFNREKEIVTTTPRGGNGTVKEMWAFSDWNIRLRGLCLDEPGVSAHDLKRRLLEFENVCDSIDVMGEVFDEKYVFRIVIKSIQIRQLEGRPNVIPFEISALSDTAVELENL